jgi:type IV pilus assembly protein PilY1
MKSSKAIVILCVLSLFLGAGRMGSAAEPAMVDYTHYPLFQVNAVQPNILIILDNSGSMNLQAYRGNYDHNTKYYGYFEPSVKYSYGSEIFVRDTSGSWDGNFLNWLTMRRIDVARKVLMGGLATARTGGGNQTNIGEAPGAGYDFTKTYIDPGSMTPLADNVSYDYLVDGGYFEVNGARYTIRVQKDITFPDEAGNFVDGNISGVLQKVGSKARWGNEFFKLGTGANKSGGTIVSTIGTNMTSLITDLQNTACDTWTPLAEAYYVAMLYFMQEDPEPGLDYKDDIPNNNLGDDPYYNGTEFVECADSFVILITDGGSSYDRMIPDSLKDYDKDGNDPGTYPDSGSDYLDDVALYARTTDLRPDLDGDQNLILYTIYAFGGDTDDPDADPQASSHAEQLLKDAARNGGFEDKNGNNLPDLTSEWNANEDDDPDTYYRADNGYELEAKLIAAVNDILSRAAAGSAVSVLATTGEGEGNMVQAYFRPVVPVGLDEVKWVGYLQSIWVDSRGYLREDTNEDGILNVEEDNVISYYLDPASGDTKIKRFAVNQSAPYPDVENDTYELIGLSEIHPLWEAGKLLAERDPGTRKIFTYLDKDKDGQVDDTDGLFNATGEVVSFDVDSASALKPYLGVKDNATWAYLGATQDDRVTNVISYIRGTDIAGLRSRTLPVDGFDKVWKLGDIVYSTPVSIAKPLDNFHVIYSDESYQTYYNTFKDRETVVYVGGNDGMLHAFTSWKYDAGTQAFTKADSTTEAMGDELWAYIPQSLLAHLKWLPSPDYTHVDYVDLKPKLFDAKILPDDTHYTDDDTDDNWGTILLLGLNMGGKHIWAAGDFDNGSGTTVSETRHFYPTYSCLDVTDPRNPTLLWERSYADLEMTASFPAVVKVKDKWFAVFGSGPTDYDGTSSKYGHVFVVDLKTGQPYKNGTHDWLFQTTENKAFMNAPVSLDKNLNFSVDAIYLGETYLSSSWNGKLYKVTVPAVDASGNYDASDPANYVDNPLDGTHPWILSALFNATKPITAPAALSVDVFDNAWIYVGTGRYLSAPDKSSTDTQYMYGIKDPFFNEDHTASGLYGDTYYHNYGTSLELQTSDLFDADPYTVILGDDVYEGATRIGSFSDLVYAAREYDGWMRTLPIAKERILSKATILGGIVFTPSYVPNGDICGFGGDSYLYGQYYETGTAYYKPVFDEETTTVSVNGVDMEKVVDKIRLGEGKASAVGVHVGSAGAKALIQQSTGTVINERLHPAFNIKSGLRSWLEK